MLSFKNIAPFLNTGENKASRWLSYIGLGIGVLLLLCSVQMYININELLKNKSPKKNGFDFIAITKNITDENMVSDHSFSAADLAELKQQKFLDDVSPLIGNKFVIDANGGSMLPFSTDFFAEAIDNSFLDTLPSSFKWAPGDQVIPIIVSSDYFEIYNTLFAPSRDLPQFSEKTIASVFIQLDCSGNGARDSYKGNIVALSDRINTVLLPKSFLEWANKKYAGIDNFNPSRIYIKTKDANNPELLNFLQQKNYHVNKDKTKFGRIKQVLQAIVSGLAGFGVLVILLAMVLFSFYLQLMIARSKENLQLLLTLGYSPQWLSKTVAKKWIPVYVAVVIAAVSATALLHWSFQRFFMKGKEELSPFIHWSVIAIALVLLVLSVVVNFRLVKKLLYKL
ncbi:FtsX-like permease family protein [Ferruginibacter profundus]